MIIKSVTYSHERVRQSLTARRQQLTLLGQESIPPISVSWSLDLADTLRREEILLRLEIKLKLASSVQAIERRERNLIVRRIEASKRWHEPILNSIRKHQALLAQASIDYGIRRCHYSLIRKPSSLF